MTTTATHAAANSKKMSQLWTFLICTGLLLVSFMAFGKRPMSWYYHNLVDGDGSHSSTALLAGDDFDPTAETMVLPHEKQQQRRQHLRGATPVKAKTDRASGSAEELMDLNLLVGQ